MASKAPAAPLWKRLLLAAGSVLATALVLEGATRVFVPPPAPVAFQEGVYVNQLALVTGRDTHEQVLGRPLPEEKRAGEIRIFVFGESSVAGTPWGYAGSPATLLHDHLAARWPGRDITVVNMGEGAATTLDSYYFLASIPRYAPDFIVFYQGANDFFDVDRERCAPVLHPWAYAAYRALVERSRFLWTARALGPAALVRRLPPHRGQAGGAKDKGYCDAGAGFQAWTDILVRTAKRTGARVVVTTSVENPLHAHERPAPWGVAQATSLAGKTEAYRRVLACELTDGCDLVEVLRQEREDEHEGWVQGRGAAWHRSAAEAAVPIIDFGAYLGAHAEGGLRPPLFAEEVHLSVEGYWWLSWLWAQQIGAAIDGGAFDATTAGPPPPLPAARYLESVARDSNEVMACTLLHCADTYVQMNRLLVGATLLRSAVAFDVDEPGGAAGSPSGRAAQLLIGGMRRDLGLDPALPPSLGAELGSRSLDDLGRALRDLPSCRSVGRRAGPAERALLAPLSAGGDLGGYRVVRINAVRDGVIRIVVDRGSEEVELQVALDGPNGPSPPAVAGRYAVFYTSRGSGDAEAGRLAGVLAAVIEKNGAVPIPPGLSEMKMGPSP